MSTPLLTIHPVLRDFVDRELLPDLNIDSDAFWSGCAELISALTPQNKTLLEKRDALQTSIDDYHRDHAITSFDVDHYRQFLEHIGYLAPPAGEATVRTRNVDDEIASIAGPQLVVPVSNPRFALNAANARWGSLYDALYGTDVIDRGGEQAPGKAYNPIRGAAVVRYAQGFLNDTFALACGSHQDVSAYVLDQAQTPVRLSVQLADGSLTALADPTQFVGFTESAGKATLLLRHHGLHAELVIDPEHPIGKTSPAGLSDVRLESAVTTIQDCEDSVAAVDAQDKVEVYRNWLGLMRGTLDTTFDKGGRSLTRSLHEDRRYAGVDGAALTLPGRSLMLVRNVGHLMTCDALLDANGDEVFEGILDAIITTTCALYDLREQTKRRNSRTGSVYIVKPKMHGPEEVAFANTLFDRVEDLLGLARHTIKIGVMDEERRTTINLAQCIEQVRDRLVFINTGFLDRTGDEIHTSMKSGAMPPKETIKAQRWIAAYEDWNVDNGLACALPGKAQIGKGMWPKPDEMQQMLDTKSVHPLAGANCAWVPSPTAATLHAMHYHQVDVFARQRELRQREPAALNDLLNPPSVFSVPLTAAQIRAELDNNAQGILGYVVRWIDQGVGCSKVPDIQDVGLMEDRATLRISSQLLANWLEHDICTEDDVRDTFARMAEVVDRQNANDPSYTPMGPDCNDSLAFTAALELVLSGATQPNGYTEPLLHAFRKKRKAQPS
ncbi:MAG: malate synthase G [Gammaproteobacteria bacterium]